MAFRAGVWQSGAFNHVMDHRSLLEKKKAEVAIRFDPHFLALQCPEFFLLDR